MMKLTIIQRWFRGVLLSKKLKGKMRGIIEIYYHPEMKGGYFAKKDLMSLFKNEI